MHFRSEPSVKSPQLVAQRLADNVADKIEDEHVIGAALIGTETRLK